jgi:flagellar biogenesis protein FliO
MQQNIILKMAIALTTIFVIIAILVVITNKLKNYQFIAAQKSKKKLKILDFIFIDNNTKVVLIQNATTEHLVIVSKESTTLLETTKVKDENIT